MWAKSRGHVCVWCVCRDMPFHQGDCKSIKCPASDDGCEWRVCAIRLLGLAERKLPNSHGTSSFLLLLQLYRYSLVIDNSSRPLHSLFLSIFLNFKVSGAICNWLEKEREREAEWFRTDLVFGSFTIRSYFARGKNRYKEKYISARARRRRENARERENALSLAALSLFLSLYV